jgi:UDP-GlcNAc:undecaprenyl-phosphate GlcNAc-1-phosphate transferase
MNLIDGLDGLAGGVALIALATMSALCWVDGHSVNLLFTAALSGAVLGFLFYNFSPATIFMGDSGSMFLGFVLATTAVSSNQKSSTAVALGIPILALGVPIADTLLAMARRTASGAPLFSADRGHIHHRLIDRGMTAKQAVLLIYGGAAVLGTGAIILRFADSMQAALVLLSEALLVFVALRVLGYVDLSKTEATLSERRRNLEMRAAVRRVGAALRNAQTPEQLWAAVRASADALGASAVALSLGRLTGREGCGPWSAGFESEAESLRRIRYSLLVDRPGEDHLEFGWSSGSTRLDRGTELAVELLCDQVAAALPRIERGLGVRDSGNVVAIRR